MCMRPWRRIWRGLILANNIGVYIRALPLSAVRKSVKVNYLYAVLYARIQIVERNHIFGVIIRYLHKLARFTVGIFGQPYAT